MAIVKMKRLRAAAMAKDRDALLQALLRIGCVEISEPDRLMTAPDWPARMRRGSSALAQTRGASADAAAAMEALRRYAGEKDGLFIRRRAVSEKEFLSAETEALAKADCDRINGLTARLAALDAERDRLTAQAEALRPWRELDFPLETRDTAHVCFRLLVCPAAADVGAVRAELAARAAAELYPAGTDRTQQYLLLVCWRADEAAAMELLRRAGFGATAFPGLTGTAGENLAALERALAENSARRTRTLGELAESGGAGERLRVYADRLAAREAQEIGAQRLVSDGTIVFFEGWVPAEAEERLAALLNGWDCAWEMLDPEETELDDVPVRLKNNWFTRPLNMVTEMYSLPHYGGLDPNPLMAPFFVLFYGVMMADMGYGLMMLLASLIVRKKYRPKGTMDHFTGLLGLCGVSTFLMGALTGGFFGDFLTQLVSILRPGTEFALPALFTPLDDTLMILIGSMCLGFVQILTGMVIDVVKKVRRGQIMDAVWDDVTWWILYLGAALLALGVGNVGGVPVVLAAGGVMLCAGAGRNAQGFGKITAVFGAVYNGVTGIFSDVLSYSRLMALMLAGSVIAQVFNTLGAIPGNAAVFLLISAVGNLLNFALNLLGCYVHDLRLQCLEYFNKFYEDGGRPFRPMAMETKYVDIQP